MMHAWQRQAYPRTHCMLYATEQAGQGSQNVRNCPPRDESDQKARTRVRIKRRSSARARSIWNINNNNIYNSRMTSASARTRINQRAFDACVSRGMRNVQLGAIALRAI